MEEKKVRPNPPTGHPEAAHAFWRREDASKRLKVLAVTEGLSASRIAQVINGELQAGKYTDFEMLPNFGFTKNAIIGACRRKKIPLSNARRHSTKVKGDVPAKLPGKEPLPLGFNRLTIPAERQRKLEEHREARQEIVAAMEEGTEGITLRDIEDGQCRKPKGTNDQDEMLCCGKPTGSKRVPYCEECNGGQRQPILTPTQLRERSIAAGK